MEVVYARTMLLRLVRVAAGLQQLQLARKAQVAPGQISLYESGLAVPTLRAAQRLATALRLPVGLLTAEVELVLLDEADCGRHCELAQPGRVVALLRIPPAPPTAVSR